MKKMNQMKEYQKPKLAVISFVSAEAISADALSDWLATQDEALKDAPITAYSESSLGI